MSIAAKVGKYAYCPSHVAFFKARGQWYARGSVTPHAGDIIFFQIGGEASHVGIVEYVSGGYVHTIEGNASGASGLTPNGGGVVQKSYPLSSSYIMGYGRPDYAIGEAARLVAVAKSQVGYLEKRSASNLDSFTANAGSANYNKYARDIWPALQAQPWCDIFVSWCAAQADKTSASTGSTTTTATTTKKEDFEMAKTYKNGSTDEPVYADTALTIKTGSLNPWETCDCLAVVDGRPLVYYKVDGKNSYKTGFVKYGGGVM